MNIILKPMLMTTMHHTLVILKNNLYKQPDNRASNNTNNMSKNIYR